MVNRLHEYEQAGFTEQRPRIIGFIEESQSECDVEVCALLA